MRPADTYYAVGESLQADVMRFLAIIALCLIAILALVRGAAPAEQSGAPVSLPASAASVVVAPAEPEPVVAPQGPAATAEPGPAPPLSRVVGPAGPVPTAELSPQAAARAPARRDAPATAAPATTTAATTTPANTPVATAAATEATVATEAMVASGSDASRGLSLRFASDRDFLQLLNRGVIELFAFNGRQVLRLEDDFQFHGARTPGQVHELLPSTIPDVVASALRAPAGDYHWGVVLPQAMARQLTSYLESGVTGELVIDRFGEVRHRGS